MGRRSGQLLHAWLLTALLGGSGAAAQTFDRYEALYGQPVDVSISDLTQSGMSYDNRAVRTHGRLEMSSAGNRVYVLRDGFGAGVLVYPVDNNIAISFDDDGMRMLGREVEVVGLFRDSAAQNTSDRGVIQFWKYVGPPEKGVKVEAKTITLESLVGRPGTRDGQTVRVVGKFRGRNLYGDLPVRSQRESKDWVIKDDLYAVWVTGRKPKGDGFDLDAGMKRDTNKWLEVVGRVESRGSVTYLQALSVTLAAPPSATADAQPPPPPPERPKAAPVVVFALPLDGDREVSTQGVFVIQFSKDMNEASFKGRVLLRYAGAVRAGDRSFDGMKLSYDGGRRALTVDPGDVLRAGREIEILLLPGIVDLEGLSLAPRGGSNVAAGAVDGMRYFTGG